MVEQIGQSLAGARLLRERIAAGDLEGAKTAWIEARIGWERAEVFTSGFVPDLDREIGTSAISSPIWSRSAMARGLMRRTS
jgi:iron uptake system EfeUOB component EfeO/EfeM